MMVFTKLYLLAIFVLAANSTNSSRSSAMMDRMVTCRTDFTLIDDRKCVKYVSDAKTLDDARIACAKDGPFRIYEPEDEATFKKLIDDMGLADDTSVLVGLRRNGLKQWKYVSDQKDSVFDVDASATDGTGDCLTFKKTGTDVEWSITDCTETHSYYVEELPDCVTKETDGSLIFTNYDIRLILEVVSQ